MEKISLLLIVMGLVIIGAVLFARWRLRRAQLQPPVPPPRRVHDEPEYDPLFALDNKTPARHDVDDWDVVPVEPRPVNKIAPPPMPARTPEAVEPSIAPPSRPQAAPASRRRSAPRVVTDPDRVITINVMAPQGQRFAGGAIAAAAQLAELELGTWSIYHYYSKDAPDAPPLFSVANMVKPGSFDPEHMHEISTVGLSLFMVPAGDENDIAALEVLLATARQLASDLGGEVRDARRSVLTRQAIEHMREQLNEWRFKSRAAQS